MPATRYKLWEWGNPVGDGKAESCHVGVSGVAKTFTDDRPFAVANELICAELAHALKLPVPPGFVVEHEGQPYFASLNFNLSGADLPPADCASLVAAHPDLACGIVLFDMWTLNRDRHRKNVSYDIVGRGVQIFDHDRALFGPDRGTRRFAELQNDVVVLGHCLGQHMVASNGFPHWASRIEQIPEFYIRDTVAAAVGLGITREQADQCAAFLLARRTKLLQLTRKLPGPFPRLALGLWAQDDQEVA